MDSATITDMQTNTDSLDVTVTVKKKSYHKTVLCKFCGRWMQDNNMKRHMKTHADLTVMKDENDIREEIRKRKLVKDEQVVQMRKVAKIATAEGASPSCYEQSFQTTKSSIPADFDEELLQYNTIYLEKMERGKKIHEALIKGIVIEDALPKQFREALEIYRKSYRPIDLIDVELRPWQQELMEKINVPTEREVIWVKGIKGNEGKTWFQKYVRSLFGYSRVAMLDLKSKTANILHALRKFSLSTVDIFFFNDARAINYEHCCYTALENLKDGSATASKFNSEWIQFKTPNVVVVFSNSDPDVKQLSKDRWKIYYITISGLNSHEDRLWKLRHTPKTRQSDFGRNDTLY